MEDSLTRTPINHRAKFDAARFILSGEIRNRTSTYKKQTVTYGPVWIVVDSCQTVSKIGHFGPLMHESVLLRSLQRCSSLCSCIS